MGKPSHWFIPARFRRLASILSTIHGAPPGVAVYRATRQAWRVCGGPLGEMADYLRLLVEHDLIRLHNGAYFRTSGGNRVTRALRKGDRTVLALTLIHAGCFHDQARRLIERGKNDAQMRLVVARREAIVCAPQLVSLLEVWNDVEVRPQVVIPSQLVTELETAWALRAPETEIPEWQRQRKAVGDRAELYTFQFERARAVDRNRIHWVSRDSDDLGWDVEDRSSSPARRIEVKGSRERREMFFLSENEWNRAREHGDKYCVHFWGAIDLGRDVSLEYSALRAEGYPVEIPNPVKAIDDGAWVATATRWRIERGTL